MYLKEIQIPERKGLAAKLYLLCLALVQGDFPSLRDDENGCGAHEVIELVIMIILVVVLVVVVTALLPTYNSSLTNYSTNSTSGLGTVVSTISRLLLDVAILLVIVIGLLSVALKYGGGKAGHKGL